MARFPTGKSPDGVQWKEKSALTMMLNPRGGSRPLIGETERLSTTITHQVRGGSVFVGSNAIYAAIHQFGGTIRPQKAKALALGWGAVHPR